MEQGGDDGRGKRKMLSKQLSRRGKGRGTNSSTAAPPAYDKDAHQQYVEAEERL
jgi:hypothetical protein